MIKANILSPILGLLLLGLVAVSELFAQTSIEPITPHKKNSGGMLTVQGEHSRVLLSAIDNLSPEHQQKRRRGHAFFNTLFISGESEVPKRQGLGPLFNGASCEVCHNRLGKGQMPNLTDTQPSALVFQLSTLQKNQQWQTFHPVYGDIFNPFAIPGVPDEGRIEMNYNIIKGTFSDGSPWELSSPSYTFKTLNYGSFEDKEIIKTAFSPRLAQSLIGMGLLEAISEQDIMRNADPDDENHDGISGRAHYFRHDNQVRLGRFGWKATHVNLRAQITDALKNEQGIKTTDHPHTSCTKQQIACLNADLKGKNIELTNEDLEAILFFTQTIPVPERRNINDEQVLKGEIVFNTLACQQCHISSFRTQKQAGLPLLSQQTISPYTDLLLHDMGEDLADNRPVLDASGREWRTAPLWGIGLNKLISGTESYLHDGRAKTLTQAILWHGGEAELSKQQFLQLNKSNRDNLIAFLKSL